MIAKLLKQLAIACLLWPVLGYAVAVYQVEKVYDGDTILLTNGWKVRFLEINTPEVAGRGKAAQPGGEQAKHWLQTQLQHQQISLETDVERQDKYGRMLAYVFSADGRFINLELVKNGLATVSIFPPNLKYADELLLAEHNAEQAGIGIWAYPEYAPLPFQALNQSNYQGWKRISGRVQAIKPTAKGAYLQFSRQTAIHITGQDLALFPPLNNYLGKNMEVRGWVQKAGKRFNIIVRHPGQIKQLKP